MKKSKFLALSLMVCSGAALLQGGCLGSFWNGFWNGGLGGPKWLDISFDVLNEVIFG